MTDQSQSLETTSAAALPPVPLTVEGSAVLHQMMEFDRVSWRELSHRDRESIVAEAEEWLSSQEAEGPNQSAIFSMLGHKGDLLLVHFRETFEALAQAQLSVAQLRLSDYLDASSSYLSVVELGLYNSTPGIYSGLLKRGITAHSEEWNAEIEKLLEKQREQLAPRLWPSIPNRRYLCFYPMDRKRGERDNWYSAQLEERKNLMHEHGMTGRRYAGAVQQIITGSIGFDDWEWGVDLFADDPLVFKKLVYEMRFDEVSARFAEFGSFYVGLRFPASGLGEWISGTLPEFGR